MDRLLLKTKLHAPPTRTGFVSRDRLLCQLDETAGGGVVLVSAPAGFGKTSLLTDWLHACGGTSAWLTVDVDDNDPSRFLDYLTAAIRVSLPSTGPSISDEEIREGAHERVLPRLLNAIEASDSPRFVLVLDDYHLISNRTVHRCVEYVAEHLPPRAVLVISTRADPPFSLTVLRAGGSLQEVRARALRFDFGEAEQFFSQAPSPLLTHAQLGSLHARTEGWAAGMQMAAVSMAGLTEASAFIRSFAASNRYVLDYLLHEVLSHQSKALQRFLLTTSILDPLCSRLCEYLTDDHDSQAHLEELERRNVFISPLDSECVWYHYHRLFADLLQRRLADTDAEELRRLHLRAGEWYESEGMLAKALRHYGSAGSRQTVVRLIENQGEQLLANGELGAFVECLSLLPETAPKQRPLLKIYFACALLVSGESMQRIEELIGPSVFEEVPPGLEGEHAALSALLCAFKADAREGTRWCRIASDRLGAHRVFLRGIVQRVATLLTYTDSGDVDSAIEEMRANLAIERHTGSTMTTVTSFCELGDLYATAGRLRQAEAAYREGLDYASERENLDTPISGLPLIGLGNLMRERGELRNAEETLVDGLSRAAQLSSFGCLEGQIALARTRRALGDDVGAAEAIETARRIAERFDATDLDDLFVELHAARFLIQDGDLRGAERIVGGVRDRPSVRRDDLTYLIRELLSLIDVRLLIASDQPERAAESLERLTAQADSLGRQGSRIEMLTLEAVAHDCSGETDLAAGALAKAVQLASGEGYVRVFLDEGPRIPALLETLEPAGAEAEYIQRVLGGMPRETHPTGSESLAQAALLTNRELQVIQLLSDGLTNQEIADRLFISVRTVKWHTVHIYEKLRVGNRTQAVARARVMGILAG